MRACFLNFKAPHLAKFSWCVSTDLASQGWLREFCSRFTMNRQSMVQFPGFTFYWPTFGFPLTSAILLGRDNHRVSLRQLQISKQDNRGVQRKFAFSRQFVRGSVGTPEDIPSISGNHWIHGLEPFILDLGSWKHSKHFKQPLDSLSSAFYFGSWIRGLQIVHVCAIQIIRLDIRHRTRSFFIWLNPRGEIYFSLKELIAMFTKVRFTTCRDTRFGRTLWNEEISLGR